MAPCEIVLRDVETNVIFEERNGYEELIYTIFPLQACAIY